MRRWIEGFETDKSLTDLQRKYVQAGSTFINNATFGAGEIQGSYYESVGVLSRFATPLFTAKDTWIIGARISVDSTQITPVNIIQLLEGSSHRVSLWTTRPEPGNTSEHYFAIGVGGISLFTSARIPNGEWHYHEIMIKIHASEGRVEWRIDGFLVAFGEHLNTSFLGTSVQANRIDFASHDVRFDDIYVNDTDGDYNNAFDGEQVVEGIFPVSDAGPNDWSPSTGSDHYAMVDEAPSDDDTSYLGNLYNDLEERFEVSMPVYARKRIDSIVVAAVSKIASAGSRDLTLIADSGEDQTEDKAIDHTTYDYHQMILPRDHKGDPWTVSSIEALKIGMKS